MVRLSRRRLLHGLAAGAAASVLPQQLAFGQETRPAPAVSEVSESARVAMAAAAVAFLDALPADVRRRTVFTLSDKERLNWHYVPRRREGVPFKEMPSRARAAAHELMKSSLSGVGYGKATSIMRLEEVLRRLETFGLMRDPDNYAFSVFGSPGPSAPWGWRVEGHHLSLNFTLVPGRPVAMTPAFLGANPAEVPSGPQRGLRVLAAEQDMARALIQSLTTTQRARAVIAAESLGDIVTGPGRADSLATPAGLAVADMTSEQRGQTLRLVEDYVLTMRSELAEQELSRMRQADPALIHFAWAGPIEPGKPHYYRLHGPTLLIEYDNTQNDANHIHSVWHDPRHDFGLDALKAHYDRGHRHS
ncbi:MAG TPA: DUF3500 domain-containing protein [Candidatus Methylomirabilis sp.]|nr:DUF3500 domain-containing protein [Candidatus Methylomirabilis sp.]